MFTEDLRQRDATHFVSDHPEGLQSQDMGVRPGFGGGGFIPWVQSRQRGTAKPCHALPSPTPAYAVISACIITEHSFCIRHNRHFQVISNICGTWSVICSHCVRLWWTAPQNHLNTIPHLWCMHMVGNQTIEGWGWCACRSEAWVGGRASNLLPLPKPKPNDAHAVQIEL